MILTSGCVSVFKLVLDNVTIGFTVILVHLLRIYKIDQLYHFALKYIHFCFQALETWVIIVITLVASIVLGLFIVGITCYLKRENAYSKYSRIRLY